MREALDSEDIHQFTPEGVINGRKLPTAYERPCEMPILGEGEVLVAVFDSGMGVRISYFKVDNLTGMQEIWDKYAQGYAIEPPKFIIAKEAEVMDPQTLRSPTGDGELNEHESLRFLLITMLGINPSVDNVIKLMEGSQSQKEWGENCEHVRRVFGGNYPDFWFQEIITSGIAAKVEKKYI